MSFDPLWRKAFWMRLEIADSRRRASHGRERVDGGWRRVPSAWEVVGAWEGKLKMRSMPARAACGRARLTAVWTMSATLQFVKSPRPAFDLDAVQAQSKKLHDLVRISRQGQLNRIGPNDPNSPIRVLVELDILNAYERIRAYYLNVAETLAGGK